MTESARSSLADAAPASLDDLLDELAAQMQDGEPVDVEAFLHAHPEYADELRRMLPAMQVLAGLEASRSGPAGADADPGDAIGELGDYRLIREVGRGGMGVVYEAEQISLRRRVALKLLPFASALDGRQLQRFKNEAQAAAHLHHTNIVPVYAVGCKRGVHYYAMQFIDGHTLADVIHELRGGPSSRSGEHHSPADASGSFGASGASCTVGLHAHSAGAGVIDLGPAVQRLTTANPKPASATAPVAALPTERSHTTRPFFRTVAQWGIQAAEALDHAHEQGVIHRDIKPANLLIDAKGLLWITDFGLAQFQTDANLTLTGDLIGTVRYMSPEQALAKRIPVDHRTDVYSLGATLYELLTLHPVFDGRDRSELLRQISFDEPKAPRRHNGSIPRELETIVLKALEKHPDGRYATAQELADDLRHWLDDKPIRAKRPGLRERVLKWMRRHRYLVRSAVAVLVVAVGVLAASTAMIAREMRRAEDGFRSACEAVDEMYTQVATEWLDDAPGLTAVQKKFLEKALSFYERIANDRGNDDALSYEVARAFVRLGRIRAKLGRHEDAEVAYKQAIDRSEKLAGEHMDDARYVDNLASAYCHLGSLLDIAQRFPDAERSFLCAISQWEHLVIANPEVPGSWPQLANCLDNLGLLYEYTQRPEAARTVVRAIEITERLVGAFPNDPTYQSALGSVLSHYAKVQMGRDPGRVVGDPAEVKSLLTRAISHQENAQKANPRRVAPRRRLAYHHSLMGELLQHVGKTQEAIFAYEQAASLVQTLVSDFPDVPAFRRDLAQHSRFRAGLLEVSGRIPEAKDVQGKALAVCRGLANEFPDVTENQQSLALSLMRWASLATVAARDFVGPERSRFQEAENAYREAARIMEKLTDKYPNEPVHCGLLGGILNDLAILRAQHQGEPKEALDLLHLAINYQRKSLALRSDRSSHVMLRNHYLSIAHIRGYQAERLFQSGHVEEAATIYRQVKDEYEKLILEFSSQSAYQADLVQHLNKWAIQYARGGRVREALVLWWKAVETESRAKRPPAPDKYPGN